jgi:hypothetical protein
LVKFLIKINLNPPIKKKKKKTSSKLRMKGALSNR